MEPDRDDELEIIEETENELGQKVIRAKMGKYNVCATYINEPSPEAIKRTNELYNELFLEFNPQPRKEKDIE